jgi:predicted transport protein
MISKSGTCLSQCGASSCHGNDVQLKELLHYLLQTNQEFAFVEVQSKRLKLFLKVPPSEV